MLLQTVKATDRLKAMEIAARYGGVDKLSMSLEEQPERELTREMIDDMWERLKRVKNVNEFEKMLVAAATRQIEGVDE